MEEQFPHDFHYQIMGWEVYGESWDFSWLHGLFPWLIKLLRKVPRLFPRFHEHFSWLPRFFLIAWVLISYTS